MPRKSQQYCCVFRPLPIFRLLLGASRLLPPILCLLVSAFWFPTSSYAQSSTATLSGTVEDQKGALVPGASIALINADQGSQRLATTNSDGRFVFPQIPPGRYSVTATREGFGPVEMKDVVLNVNDQVALRISLTVGSVSQTVDIVDGASLINESPAVGTTVDRQFVGNLPLNGRSFQSLMTLTPGVVLTKANSTEQGQFSVNGQRANANYFTIDGVGANIGVGLTFTPGQASGGSVPGFSASGGTNNLVSVDGLQEFKVQTSTYAPEFGRQPGGQVSIVTRSGTSDFHGSLSEYFRNDVLDAADWFTNSRRQKKPPLRQNIFGGVLGGPILLPRFGEGGHQPWYNGRNRTFFFFSYEGSRVRQPVVRTSSVPSLTVRQNAPVQLRPFVNAFPLPNGPNQTSGFAEFSVGFSVPSTTNSTSIRIDHNLGDKVTIFSRYNHAPSSIVQRGIASSLNTLNPVEAKTQTFTLGSTQSFTTRISNDLRVNYSTNKGLSSFVPDTLGGAIVPSDSLLFPSFASRENSVFIFSLLTTSVNVGPNVGFEQRQFNLVDGLSVVSGSHQLKLGIDYRRLSPVFSGRGYLLAVSFFGGPNQVLTGLPSNISISAQAPATAIFTNVSAYAQDTWKINRQLILTYGLRYEVNPAPSGIDGNDPIAITDASNLAGLAFAPRGTPLYGTTYNNIAPRIGIAYQLSEKPGRETVLRSGFGVFYDLGGGGVVNQFSASFPFTANRILTARAFPLISPADALPPALPASLPIARFFAVDPKLKLPYTVQWNVAVEQSLGTNQTFSVTYVGAAGRRLLRQEQVVAALNPALFTLNPALFTSTALFFLTKNADVSDYRALQLQFQRRLSSGLQTLVSYSWARSVDTTSTDSSQLLTPAGQVDPSLDSGPSDFDVRHALSGAISYEIPTPGQAVIVRRLLGNWALDTNLIARSATPVNVFMERFFGNGVFQFRPNLVSGVPLYLQGANFPGGKRINPAAFSVPTTTGHGNLGRNALRGFPVSGRSGSPPKVQFYRANQSSIQSGFLQYLESSQLR